MTSFGRVILLRPITCPVANRCLATHVTSSMIRVRQRRAKRIHSLEEFSFEQGSSCKMCQENTRKSSSVGTEKKMVRFEPCLCHPEFDESSGRLPNPRTSAAFPTHGRGYIFPIDPSPRDWIVPCGCIFFSWREMIVTLETVKDLTGRASLREAAKAYAVLTRGVLLHSPTSKSSRYHSILTFTLDYETIEILESILRLANSSR